jgi:hypothetical protein
MAMSSPVNPARPDAASMTAIRGLLERNLLERAVALAEARWPGSGPVVELAHEWAVLSPSARRERLATIGPDELARLRGIGQLQPDLARVLDDLEARGIIPPEHTVSAATADPAIPVPEPNFEESVVDAALDYSELGLQRLANSARENLPPNLEAALAADEVGAAATVAAAQAEVERRLAALDPTEPVDMPDLDLHMPSTAEFLAREAEQRQAAYDVANNILERARTQVDDIADRMTPAALPVAAVVPAEAIPLAESPLIVADVPIPAQSTRVDSSSNAELQARIEAERVIALEPGDLVPDEAALRAVAEALQRDYVALRPETLGLRSFYGGLVREGRRVEPRAGAFPEAISRPALVAVYGRLYPKMIERLRQGYCDIPGTRATVRVDPDCRIVVLPG